MDFSDIVKKRYAAKKFTGEILSEDKIDSLLELIKYAPSSLGLQSFKVIVVRNQALKDKLSPASYDQAQIKTCSHLLVICADTDMDTHVNAYFKVMEAQGVTQEKIKARKELMNRYISNNTDVKTWAQKQCYIALGNALNGATSLGLDSCPMEGFDPVAYKEILELPENLYPTVLAPIGIAADEAGTKIRLPDNVLFEKRN